MAEPRAPSLSAAPTLAQASGLQSLLDAPVQVRVTGSPLIMTLDALLQLRPEHALPLGEAADKEVQLFVNDQMVARGTLVLKDGRIGVTLTHIVDGRTEKGADQGA